MLTIITPTGNRPKAFSLCETMMARQTYAGKVRWIIVDDGTPSQDVSFQRDGWKVKVVRPKPLWKKGNNTQARNMLAGLAHVSSDDVVVIVEDDDYYHPTWLDVIAIQSRHAELVGETCARYYNVATGRYGEMTNSHHASLCASAVRGSAIDTLRDVCDEKCKFIDVELWRRVSDSHLFSGHRVVGIKGLPGRDGIGIGHRATFGSVDAEGNILRGWIGGDVAMYG